MIIDTADFGALPGLVSATLQESTDAAATLSLEWSGYCPAWVGWEEPVTVMHRGRVLFHGKVTSFANSCTEEGESGTATATNALWLLDNLNLGAQVSEWQAGQSGSATPQGAGKRNLARAAGTAMRSWQALAESCRAEAPGWVVDAEGNPREDGQLWLDTTEAEYSIGVPSTHKGAITPWTALLEMKQANPDAVFLVDYTTGAIRVVSIGRAEGVTWHTAEVHMTEMSDIAPQYEDTITGVLLLVSWETEQDAGSLSLRYPPDLPETSDRVRMFTASAPDRERATAQLDYMGAQLRRYYEACNILQWGGTVTSLIPTVPVSPLGMRLNLEGARVHDSWRTMAAIVSAVTWDFKEGTVQVTLGRAFDEPTLSELEFEDDADTTGDDGDGADEDTTADDPGWDDQTTKDKDPTEGGTDYGGVPDPATDTGTGTGTDTGTGTGTGTGSEQDRGNGRISLQQQIFNAIVHLRLWGNGADVTMPRHYVPDIFPDWWDTKMDERELIDNLIKLTGCNQFGDDHHGFGQ